MMSSARDAIGYVGAFGIVAALLSWSASSADERTIARAHAAGDIIGFVTGRQALIGQCREADTDHAAGYDRVFLAYIKTSTTIHNRAIEVLTIEAKKAGEPEAEIKSTLDEITRKVVDEVIQMKNVNPGLFGKQCQSLLTLHSIDAEWELRQYIPQQVDLINKEVE